MIKRWPRRREFLSYYLLLRVFGGREFSLGEAVELLEPVMGSRRVASRLVRRLVKQGFLTRTAPMRYRARGLDDVLGEALAVYVAKRLRRQGVEAWECRGRVVVEREACETLPEGLRRVLVDCGTVDDEEQCKG